MSGPAGEPDQQSGQLDREAAHWSAVMHGPDADLRRPDFEAWLRRGALHRRAYNRMEEVFLLGSRLPSRLLVDKPGAKPVGRITALQVAAVGLISAAILLAAALALHAGRNWDGPDLTLADPNTKLRLSTLRVSGGTFRLADGSNVTLAPDTEVAVDYDRHARRFRLARGRSRFQVAHQLRPFIVEANGGTVTAHGKSFEVAILPSRHFRVSVLEGSVEVVVPRDATEGQQTPRSLSAGEAMTFGQRDQSGPAISAGASGNVQPFTVGELVRSANAFGGGPPLEIADPSLLGVKLGGSFRVHGPAEVAERLALMFDLEVRRSARGIVLLRRRGR